MITTTTTASTLILAAEDGSSFLADGSFWNGLWKVGAVVVVLLAAAAAYGATGSVIRAIGSCIWRIPVGLVVWSALWVILFGVGSLLELASQNYANRNSAPPPPDTAVCQQLDLSECDQPDPTGVQTP